MFPNVINVLSSNRLTIHRGRNFRYVTIDLLDSVPLGVVMPRNLSVFKNRQGKVHKFTVDRPSKHNLLGFHFWSMRSLICWFSTAEQGRDIIYCPCSLNIPARDQVLMQMGLQSDSLTILMWNILLFCFAATENCTDFIFIFFKLISQFVS